MTKYLCNSTVLLTLLRMRELYTYNIKRSNINIFNAKNEYSFSEWQRIYRYGNVCKCMLPPEIFHTVKKKNKKPNKTVTMATSRERNRGDKIRRAALR